MKKRTLNVALFPNIGVVVNEEKILSFLESIRDKYSSTHDICIICENKNVYDFNYYGFNICGYYQAVINKIKNNGFELLTVTHRNLFSHILSTISSVEYIFIGVTPQHTRSLKDFYKHSELSNILCLYIFNPSIWDFQKYNITDSFEMKYTECDSFRDATDDEVRNYCHIDLNHYDSSDIRAMSHVYKPLDKACDLFKVLKGDYSRAYIEMLRSLNRIKQFLASNKIPNALPEIVVDEPNSGLLIIRESYINGIELTFMISQTGIKENLYKNCKKDQQRILIVNYIRKICQTVYFYHFLGLFLNDIKEDNFIYTNDESIIPIDSDGYSFYMYPTTFPKITHPYYNNSVKQSSQYFHNTISEGYSFSYMIYKILFGNSEPVDEKKTKKSLKNWVYADESRLDDWSRISKKLWNALPSYIKTSLLFLFCNDTSTISSFDCEEWVLLIQQYDNDLKTTAKPILDFDNEKNYIFKNSTEYFKAKIISSSYLSVVKRVLLYANVGVAITIIGTVIHIFLT